MRFEVDECLFGSLWVDRSSETYMIFDYPCITSFFVENPYIHIFLWSGWTRVLISLTGSGFFLSVYVCILFSFIDKIGKIGKITCSLKRSVVHV